jgi:hypothetical protein
MKSEKHIFQEAMNIFSQEIKKTNITSQEKTSRQTEDEYLLLLDEKIENI